MTNAKKIALIGGTGKAGRVVLQQLLTYKIPCKVLIRNPDRQPDVHPLMEIVYGDARDYNSLETVMQDCDAVLCCLGTSKGEKPVQTVAISNIVRTMKSNGIKRLITLFGTTLIVPGDRPSFRTKWTRWVLRICFPAVLRDKQQAFEKMVASDLNWTAVRMPFLKSTGEKSTLKCSTLDCPGTVVEALNVADFIIEQIQDAQYIHCAPFIAN